MGRVRLNRPERLDLLRKIFDRDGTLCWICRVPLDRKSSDLRLRVTLDHVTPASEGGDLQLYNLKAAHALCNERRGTLTDPASIRKWCRREVQRRISQTAVTERPNSTHS